MKISNFNYHKSKYWAIILTDFNVDNDYETPIKNYLLEHVSPDNLLIIYPSENSFPNLELDRFPNKATIIVSNYYLSENGEIVKKTSGNVIEKSLLEKIRDSFLSLIFNSHECVLSSSQHSYYCLPSGYFSTHFIRVGNMFANGTDIYCISLFLLPYLKNRPNIIYCDSPSIFPIIYGTIHLINKINSKYYSPLIKSFSSHTINIDNHVFTSIFFISTSITGLLTNKLNSEKGVDWSNIVVLINLVSGKINYQVLQDFSKKLPKSLNEFNCLPSKEFLNKFPNKKFSIKFETDQFIPLPPQISTILISKEDAPENLSEIIQRYFRSNFISCYYGFNSKNKTRDLYFDIKLLLRSFNQENPNYFEKKAAKLLLNNLPINVGKIIYIDELESKYIAQLLKDYYHSNYNLNIEIENYKNLKDLNNETPVTYIVCSSCISEGKKIFNVSRLLRNQENFQILYFNGIIRCKNQESLKELRSNLKYGEYGFNTYQLISIEELFLPNEDSDTITWELEKDFLNKLLNGFNNFNVDSFLTIKVKRFFNKRLKDLNSGKLINNVFLNKLNGNPLKLNKNFAFFDFTSWHPTEVSQSLVYFTIISVIHNFRNKHKVQQTVYERFLLKPENFNRYNDGVIQAALLRSSSTLELNYEIDEKSSNLMSDIINHSISDSDNIDSAPYEFLLAICIKKLTLRNNDLIKLFELNKNNKDGVIKLFLNFIDKVIIRYN